MDMGEDLFLGLLVFAGLDAWNGGENVLFCCWWLVVVCRAESKEIIKGHNSVIPMYITLSGNFPLSLPLTTFS